MVDYDELEDVLRSGPPRPIAPYSCEGDKDGRHRHSVCHGGVTDPQHVCVATVYGRTEDEAEAYAAAICAAYNTAQAMARELAALRAIVAGRATPPTEAERDAHSAAGGVWLVSYVRRDGDLASEVLSGWGGDLPCGAVYIALDARGIPCAWPVV